jgi:K+-transporting ATPase KdpF subunit
MGVAEWIALAVAALLLLYLAYSMLYPENF